MEMAVLRAQAVRRQLQRSSVTISTSHDRRQLHMASSLTDALFDAGTPPRRLRLPPSPARPKSRSDAEQDEEEARSQQENTLPVPAPELYPPLHLEFRDLPTPGSADKSRRGRDAAAAAAAAATQPRPEPASGGARRSLLSAMPAASPQSTPGRSRDGHETASWTLAGSMASDLHLAGTDEGRRWPAPQDSLASTSETGLQSWLRAAASPNAYRDSLRPHTGPGGRQVLAPRERGPGSAPPRTLVAYEGLHRGGLSRLAPMVRGYLVRKLLATERVQGVVKMIKVGMMEGLGNGGI